MRNSPFFLVLVGLMVLLDFYVFQAVRLVSAPAAARTRSIIYIAYWTVSALSLVLMLLLPYLNFRPDQSTLRSVLLVAIFGLFFGKLVASVFLLVDDIRRLLQWGAGKLFFRNTEGEGMQEGEGISRSHFLSWLGLAAGGGLFASLLYGFTNKYDYRVRRVKMSFANLPAAFKGLRIVQLSDIHSGSLTNREAVIKGVERVMALKPDLILFTGDLVNNLATEVDPFLEVFNRLRAPLGVYSVLGNHDYADYVEWESPAAKAANLASLKEKQRQLGWNLLLNEHVVIERDGERMALLGVENWSAKSNFPKYGDLSAAHRGSEGIPFKILMSHDPSHWDAQVRAKYTDIDLMLAGHTHGMQFGVELPGFRWSPVQYVYRQWAGLYQTGGQRLYVNRGFGFLGYPGRVGILPEITVIELA